MLETSKQKFEREKAGTYIGCWFDGCELILEAWRQLEYGISMLEIWSDEAKPWHPDHKARLDVITGLNKALESINEIIDANAEYFEE